MTEWNRQFRSVPVVPTVALGGAEHAARIGVSIEAASGPEPELCGRLR
jgi:hypothetical protein